MGNTANRITVMAIASYAIKLIIDVVMFMFTVYNQNDLYYDDWYLYVPHIVSTIMMIVFYAYFFKDYFEGIKIKGTAAVLLFGNLVFLALLTFDRSKNYILYFSLVAAMNFFNALFMKINIVPERRAGTSGHGPMIFELVTFVAMTLSLYSLFCSFPLSRNAITMQWEYYDIFNGMMVNIVAELILFIQYIICRLHDSEYILQMMTYYESDEW